MVKNLPAMQEAQETRVPSLGWEDLLEKEMATSLVLPGENRGQRSLAGHSPWCYKGTGHELVPEHTQHSLGDLRWHFHY